MAGALSSPPPEGGKVVAGGQGTGVVGTQHPQLVGQQLLIRRGSCSIASCPYKTCITAVLPDPDGPSTTTRPTRRADTAPCHASTSSRTTPARDCKNKLTDPPARPAAANMAQVSR